MDDLVQDASQFIIATHSPILMAYPNATIYSLENEAIQEIDYTDTEHFVVTKQFLINHEKILETLLKE